jgi:hypothetical protein
MRYVAIIVKNKVISHEYREEMHSKVEEYKINGEGSFIFEVRDPKSGAKMCLDAISSSSYIRMLP